MATYREIYMNSIAAGLSCEEIKRRFEMMVVSADGDRPLAGENLGYILGYYGKEIREEWYGCLSDEDTPVVHPVFGVEFGRGKEPTLEEALQAGKDWALSQKPGSELGG